MKKIHTCISKAVYVPMREPFKKKDVYFCKQTKVPHTPLKIHMLHMHPVGHEQPSILFVQVEEVTLELGLISTSKLIPKYCYNIQNAIAIYIYISGTDPGGGPDALRSKKKKKLVIIFFIYIYIYINQGRTQVGARTPPGPKKFLFLVIIFFIFFVRPLPKL